jgi:hypothetical protein
MNKVINPSFSLFLNKIQNMNVGIKGMKKRKCDYVYLKIKIINELSCRFFSLLYFFYKEE